MEQSEPLPLLLVTYRGALTVNDNGSIVTRRAARDQTGQLFETLVEMTHHQAERLGQMVNVLNVVPAPAVTFVATAISSSTVVINT